MKKKDFKKGLIRLGIGTIIATGIVLYFISKETIEPEPKDYLTWEEYQAIIEAYNIKINEIKADCENDVRCIIKRGEQRVIFRNVKNKKDAIDTLNKWIETEDSIYKIKK